MADITRDQFNESRLVEYKVFQKETPAVDSDFNEQIQIARYRQMRNLSALVGQINKRIGRGFRVEANAAANTATIKAGTIIVHLSSGLAIPLRLSADTTISGWGTPGGTRTDYVYLDIAFEEFDSTDDPNLINPTVGQESAIDMRLAWSLQKTTGAVPGTPPFGHIYISLASITRPLNDAYIDQHQITNLIPDQFERLLWCQPLLQAYETDGDLTGYGTGSANCYTQAVAGGSEYYAKIALPYRRRPEANRLIARFEARLASSGTADVKLTYGGLVSETITSILTAATAWGTFFEIILDISGVSVGTESEVKFNLRYVDAAVWARKLRIFESLY